MQSKSITRFEQLIYGAKEPSRFLLVHQTDQIGIDAAIQRYSNNQKCSANLLLV